MKATTTAASSRSPSIKKTMRKTFTRNTQARTLSKDVSLRGLSSAQIKVMRLNFHHQSMNINERKTPAMSGDVAVRRDEYND